MRVEPEPAVLDEGEHERRGERLRHAGNREGRIGGDLPTGRDVGQAGAAPPGRPVREDDRDAHAGDAGLRLEPGQPGIERHAQLGRGRDRCRRRGRRGRRLGDRRQARHGRARRRCRFGGRGCVGRRRCGGGQAGGRIGHRLGRRRREPRLAEPATDRDGRDHGGEDEAAKVAVQASSERRVMHGAPYRGSPTCTIDR